MIKKEKQFLYTNDGSIGILEARINKNGLWDIFAVSEIIAQGHATYNDKLFFSSFDKIKAFCSFRGHAFIALNNDKKWGLFYIESTSPDSRRHYILEEIEFNDLEQLLKKHNIEETDYQIIELN